MEGRKFNNINKNNHSNHLSLPQNESNDDLHTIYKLRLSMKKSLSPQRLLDTPSPDGSRELKNMLQRLVEIDTESRDLLLKVFSMLEKDEKLENFMKKRIQDPKVSRMWELVEQVLVAYQEELPNNNNNNNNNNNDDDNNNNNTLGYLVSNNDYHACMKINCGVNKDIKTRDEEQNEELKLSRFRIRTLDSTSTSAAGGAAGVKELETSVDHGKI